jgi:hypothetical protein
MANSLMELYGGGMAGPSNNYQLGGRIASARRQSEYQGEIRGLEKKQRAAAKRKRKSGLLGSLGSIAGGALGSLLGPWGTAAGAGLGRALGESSYAKSDFGGGKYAQQTRGDLTEGEKDYRKGIGERALVTAAQAAIMPGVYEKAGSWLKGLGGAGESAIEAGTGLYSQVPATEAMVGQQGVMGSLEAPTLASKFGAGDKGLGLLGLKGATPIPSSNLSGAFAPLGAGQSLGGVAQTAAEGLGAYTGSAAENLAMARKLGLDLSGGQTVRSLYEGAGYGPWAGAAKQYGSLFGRGGGWIPMMPMGGRVGTENDPNRQQQQQQTNPYGTQIFGSNNPVFGSNTDWSGLYGNTLGGAGGARRGTGTGGTFDPSAGYGTATGAAGALQQMGMGNIVNDPRFAQYAGDLPQFSMGYEQKVGDYRTGAQQGLLGISQSGASGAGGFSGSGAATTQARKQREQMIGQFGRQQRGVVEGYQADVLAGIQDIERKGEFEFDRSAAPSVATTPPGVTNIMNQNPNMSQDDAEEQYEEEMQGYYDQQYG